MLLGRLAVSPSIVANGILYRGLSLATAQPLPMISGSSMKRSLNETIAIAQELERMRAMDPNEAPNKAGGMTYL